MVVYGGAKFILFYCQYRLYIILYLWASDDPDSSRKLMGQHRPGDMFFPIALQNIQEESRHCRVNHFLLDAT